MMMKKLFLAATFIGSICFTNAQTHTNVGVNSGTGVSTDNSSFFGANAGQNSVGVENTFVGYQTGSNNTGTRNTLIGARAGQDNTSGQKNTAVGWAASRRITTGQANTSLGDSSGYVNTTGHYNVNIGVHAGYLNVTGSSNVNVGTWAGDQNTSGVDNTMIGTMAGFNNLGSRNVFIGHDSGKQELSSDKLYIDNSDTSSPLIYGDFNTDEVAINGKLGIGTNSFIDGADTYSLSVNGKVRANSVKVYTDWADYVFEDNYELSTLQEVENHIKDKGHLKDIPSAKEVEENGIELGEMNKLLLQKVEELTLYLIAQNKEINDLKNKVEAIKTNK
jgi:hypothetical protein